jgi:hypothetical protein
MNTNTTTTPITTAVPPYGEVVADVSAPVIKHREVRSVRDPVTDKQRIEVVKTKIEHPSRARELGRAIMYYFAWMTVVTGLLYFSNLLPIENGPTFKSATQPPDEI